MNRISRANYMCYVVPHLLMFGREYVLARLKKVGEGSKTSFPLIAKANSQARSECFQILWLDECCRNELASWLLR